MSSYSEYHSRPELVKKRAKVLAARNLFAALCLMILGVSVALDTANNIVSIETRDKLVDCVDPSGVCYKDGQKRTGEAVTGIVIGTKQIIVETLACNNQLPKATPEQLEACVDNRLKEKTDGTARK